MRRAIMLSVAGLAVLGAAGVGGTWWFTTGRYHQSTDDAYVQSDISVVSPKVAGYVAELKVDDNQSVRAGDVLLVIDPQDYRTAVARSEGMVAEAQAAIRNIASQLVLQASMIAQAETQVASGQAELTRSQADLVRYQGLLASDFAPRQKVETVHADVQKAVAAVERARAAVTTEKSRVAVLESQRAEAEAKLAQAQAALAQDRINLENTTIRAPVDGTVGNKGVQIGQYVKAGTELLSVVPANGTYIVANFKETQLAHMRPGQQVAIEVDAVPDHVFKARIASLSPASGAQFSLLPPENATGNFTKIVQRVPVKIALEPGDELAPSLRAGLSAEATVDTQSSGPVPVLRRGQSGAAVAMRDVRPGQ